MSPLWSDLALARAALAKAVERGVVEAPEKPEPARQQEERDAVRRVLRPRLKSCAL
ncbi:hypothetical protein GCM10022276_24230 [Sphingomonas limnosediminicola]|jgi:hypothetical protein|uniref:Uncharacterized protein n=1 Tax=Sphingomonas limnosediminicola TaxID=940133 RepID=A0ABP7LP19_9SPHN